MSTASLSEPIRQPNKSLWLRFAWKEYRMLRGFWLAILVLGVLEQWVSTLMMIDAHLIPGWLFTSAWGAAALYAVGAAVTLFGAENEERTRGFLQLLPGRWQPMFFGKLAVAAGSSILLGGVLCLTGWLIAGGIWPSADQRMLSLSVAGVAVVEALVWGLLFSLLWKQPLMAAVTAMAAASFGAQLAIQATPIAMNSFTAQSYQAAVPMRLAICLVVFALDVLLGSRWLAPLGVREKKKQGKAAVGSVVAAKPSATANLRQAAVVPWRRRMFARLLWQTWRESWKSILAAIGLGLFLTIASLGIVQALTHFDLPLTFLVLPALLGALVFRGDQKRDHRLFLATHSARPRYVWLARQVVWLGVLAMLAGGVHWWIANLAQESLVDELSSYLRSNWGYSLFNWHGESYPSDWLWSWTLRESTELVDRLLSLGWCATFAAYAIGQVCSLTFKREVLAGFIAILFSVILAAWSVVVFAWQLNPLWFMLPIGIGAMLATWLRIPDWLVGRKHLRSWLAPALVMCLPLLLVMLRLPSARLAQMDLPWPQFPYLKEPLEASLREYKQLQIARTATAIRIRQVELNQPGFPRLEDLTIDGKSWLEFGIQDPTSDFGDDNPLSPEDRKTVDRFEQERDRIFLEANRDAIAKILESRENPEIASPANGFEDEGYYQDPSIQDLLLSIDAKQRMADGDLGKAWKSIRAIVRINPQGRLYNDFNAPLVLRWAQHPQQTSAQIKSAIDDLEESFGFVPHPRESVLRSYLKTRDVILDKELPQFAEPRNVGIDGYLPFLANKLPWERERALIALDYLTTQALNFVDAFWEISPSKFRELSLSMPRSMNYAINKTVFDKHWKDFERACALTDASRTSYLAADQFGGRDYRFSFLQDWVKLETRRRALLTELALIAYRLDHGGYPAKLSELVPDYLAKLPVDPYSGGAFEYRGEGLEFPLIYRNRGIAQWTVVPAKTPLFWSVDLANARLKKLDDFMIDEDGNMKFYGEESYHGEETSVGERKYDEIIVNEWTNNEPPEEGQTVYMFRAMNSRWSVENEVFVLPGGRDKQIELRE